jgi:hypothetical protein
MKIIITPGIDERKLGDELCLNKISNSDKLFILNESGSLIWDCIKQGYNLPDISKTIIQNYKIKESKDIDSIVKLFLEQLCEKGIIRYC